MNQMSVTVIWDKFDRLQPVESDIAQYLIGEPWIKDWGRKIGGRMSRGSRAVVYGLDTPIAFYMDHGRMYRDDTLPKELVPDAGRRPSFFTNPALVVPRDVAAWVHERENSGVRVYDVPNVGTGVVHLQCLHEGEDQTDCPLLIPV